MAGTGGSAGTGGGTCLRDKLCCANDNDCVAGSECVGGTCSATVTSEGVCKPKPAKGTCWSDADCNVLAPTCQGASVCRCHDACFAMDKAGTCKSILTTQ
jgi:hypothetical protein